MKRVTVKELTVSDNIEGTYRVRKKGNKYIVIERQEEEWLNITDKCTPKLVTSCRSVDQGDGSKYLALFYNGSLIVIYKPDGTAEIKYPDKYRIQKGRCATYSFNVFIKQ